MPEFKPRLDVLAEAQRKTWAALNPTSELGFVLYGGTAIALRLGHRHSEDFDFFSKMVVAKDSIYEALPFLSAGQVLQDVRNTLTVIDPQGVKLSFFRNVRFGRIGEPETASGTAVKVASLVDLFGTKLATLLQRVEARDYQDIIAILKSGLSLQEGLGAARAIYGSQFQPAEALKALTWFEEGDLSSIDRDARAFLRRQAEAVTSIPPMQST